VWTLARAARRELLWGLPAVSREVDVWRRRARVIPDASLREDALGAIVRKRAHADGAALFWTLPRRRHPRLLALLVAYQTTWDFLDNASERGACRGEHNGRLLHRALVEGLDPDAPLSDYYRHHLCTGDEEYLRALARACREVCAALPSYTRVRTRVLGEARRCALQSINHNPDPAERDIALRRWAERERAQAWRSAARYEPRGERAVERTGGQVEREMSWFELAAAASASLVPHVLLALAAEPACRPGDVDAAHAAYLPWASLATAMLDSYADRLEDDAAGEHSYIAHYRDGGEATARVAEIVARATHEAQELRAGHRHAVIVASMVAMYLSKDSARAQAGDTGTADLVRSGGSLARLLLPVLRAWRIAYGQRD
jgi:tetraprenyl-beta-curcumene synthase